MNAKYLADVGAAKIVEQVDLTPDILVNYLKNFSRENLLQMAIKAKEMATPLSAQRVADVIIENSK